MALVPVEAKIVVKMKKGTLYAAESSDPSYPGIDLEFIPNDEDANNENILSRPRVLFDEDSETGEIAIRIWADKTKEDYTERIDFNI